MKLAFVVAFLCLLPSLHLNAQSVGLKFPSEEILDDLNYLKTSLEDTHYNLYAYVSREDFIANYQEIVAAINQDSLTQLQAITLFQRVISAANTGHAEIDFPAAAYLTYGKQNGTVFPLEVALEDNKVYVRKNYSSNTAIQPGDELLRINGTNIQEIITAIHPQLSAESIYLKNAKLEFWSLPRLYWQLYGQHKNFDITVKSGKRTSTHTLAAVGLFEGYEIPRKDVLASNRRFELFNNSAYLNPGNFSGDEVIFRRFIDSAFTTINQAASQNLIIDLRNNAGGHDAFSDYLSAYIAHRPFRWHAGFTLKSSSLLKDQTRLTADTTDAYSQAILTHPDGDIFTYEFPLYKPHSTKMRFIGNVYVLINRQTYSMAAVTAALFQDQDLAIIVGEESGDYPTLHASQFSYPLPNTSIRVKVPKGYIVRNGGGLQTEGVQPDFLLQDHLLDDTDEVLTALLAKLEGK
ncbi:MAG: S41 family peptidase [Lewinella sp.]